MADFSIAALSGLQLPRSYLDTRLGTFYSDRSNRLLLYLLLAFCFLAEGFIAWSLYQSPSFLIDKMDFTTVYALHKALIFTLGLFAADALAQWLRPGWAGVQKRTIGKQWLIWTAGLFAGYIVHRTLGMCLMIYYAPDVVGYYKAYPQAHPGDFQLFLLALPYWFCAVFITITMAQRKQRALENETEPQAVVPASTPLAKKEPGAPEIPMGALTVAADPNPRSIPFRNIIHINVEDHYSRIHFKNGNGLENVFVRRPLKDLLKELPADFFLQTHRSHVVNLSHVSALKKQGRQGCLVMDKYELELPVSRSRLGQVGGKVHSHIGRN